MKKAFCITFLFSLLFVSCSLKYAEEEITDDVNPQFVFSETQFTRYENTNKTAFLKAEQIEKYKKSDSVYAKDVNFVTFDKEACVDTQGECGYLMADNTNGLYELYDSIKFYSKEQNANFYAKGLKYNSKNQQLVSSRGDTIKIEKDDTVIYGSGFSASGISGSYSFTGMVSGELSTNSEKE